MRQALIALPIQYLPSARKVGLAISSDVGGDKSFDTIKAIDAKGTEYAVTHAYCSEMWPEYMTGFFNAPTAYLYESILKEYQTRFLDRIAPSIEEVTAFLSNAQLVIDCELDMGLDSIGLKRVIPDVVI